MGVTKIRDGTVPDTKIRDGKTNAGTIKVGDGNEAFGYSKLRRGHKIILGDCTRLRF